MILLRIESVPEVSRGIIPVRAGPDPARSQAHPRGVEDDLLQAAADVNRRETVVLAWRDGNNEPATPDSRPDLERSRDVFQTDRSPAEQAGASALRVEALDELGTIGRGEISRLEGSAGAPRAHQIEGVEIVPACGERLGRAETEFHREEIEDEHTE